MTNELYTKLICALTHNIDVCESCRRCGKGSEARINIIKELAKEEGRDLPWKDEENKDE